MTVNSDNTHKIEIDQEEVHSTNITKVWETKKIDNPDCVDYNQVYKYDNSGLHWFGSLASSRPRPISTMMMMMLMLMRMLGVGGGGDKPKKADSPGVSGGAPLKK